MPATDPSGRANRRITLRLGSRSGIVLFTGNGLHRHELVGGIAAGGALDELVAGALLGLAAAIGLVRLHVADDPALDGLRELDVVATEALGDAAQHRRARVVGAVHAMAEAHDLVAAGDLSDVAGSNGLREESADADQRQQHYGDDGPDPELFFEQQTGARD